MNYAFPRNRSPFTVGCLDSDVTQTYVIHSSSYVLREASMMELMPCASWATMFQVESELEEELRQEEKRLLRLKQVFAAKQGRVPRGALRDTRHCGRDLQ
jgi:hypothetical protein